MKTPRSHLRHLHLLTLLLGAALVITIGIIAGTRLDVTRNAPKTTAERASSRHTASDVAVPLASGGPPSTPATAVPPAPLAFRLSERLPAPVLAEPLPPKGEAIPKALQMLTSSSVIDRSSVAELQSLSVGDRIGFPSPLGGQVDGRINYSQVDALGILRVAGSLERGQGSQFALTKSGNQLSGTLLLTKDQRALIIATANDGRLLLQEKPLDAVVCAGMPLGPNENLANASPAGPQPAVVVPDLDSLPGATAVLYLDFDGETVTDPNWNSGNTIVAAPAVMGGQPITEAQITAVWQAVSEDFAGFNISVTTIRSRYDSAPFTKRMRCIQTPTNTAAPSAGGVAYVNSFSRAGVTFRQDIPCWSFNSSNVNVMAMTISHELGHTVGLVHDGFNDGHSVLTYYGGHGSGSTGWGPLMGAPFGKAVTQWSKGEYSGANNTEDDVAIISGTTNGFGFIADEAGNFIGSAVTFPDNLFGSVDQSGFISSATDVDFYRFTTAGGTVSILASPLPAEANLDIQLELYDSTGTLITTVAPGATLSANLSRSVGSGVFYLAVRGSGHPDPSGPPADGYSSYGSIGHYTLTGSFVPLPVVPLITQQPVSLQVVEGKSATFTVGTLSNAAVSYQWYKIVGGIDTKVSGATSKTLRFSAASAAHIGDYKVRVTNKAGFVDSDVVNLDVILKPKITTHPLAATYPAGSSQSLTVATIGTPTLIFQWYKDNQPIPGANTDHLNFPDVMWSDAGSYKVVVTNSVGVATSKTAVIKVNSAPVFIADPPLLVVPTNGSSILKPLIKGNSPFAYRWLKDDQVINGARGASLTIKGIPSSLGTYKLEVTNAFGTATSNGTVVEIDDRLAVTAHPTGGTVAAGDPFTLAVQTTGSEPKTYQWQLNRKNIPGANSQTLMLNPATWFDRGKYRVVIANRVSALTSKEATVNVLSPPIITIEPPDLKGARGKSIQFSVTATGSPSLKYQWTKGVTPIPRATGSKLTVSKLSDLSEGGYYVVVTNSFGSVQSRVANLIVEDAPLITVHPQPVKVAVGTPLTMMVTATGSPSLRYQWQKSNKNLPGETLDTLTIPNAQLADTGSYRVIVTNDVGAATSKTAKATVMLPPTIITDPQSASVYIGDTVTFKVKVTGTAPFSYQWKRDGTNVSKSATLTLTNVQASQAGNYTVDVSNAVGSVTSASALLTIDPIPAPVLSYFSPTQGRFASKVAIVGDNLRWTRGVYLNNKAMGYVITSNQEVIATLGFGMTSGLIKVTTRGGTVTSSSAFSVTPTPSNDNFIDNIILTGTSVVGTANTAGYTKESGEPSHAGFFGGASAWWWWRAPSSGIFDVNTAGSSFDTILAIYTGNQVNALTTIASNDDDVPFLHSRVQFPAVKGVLYHIAVDGYGGATGLATLSITPKLSAPVASANFEVSEGFKNGAAIAGTQAWVTDSPTTMGKVVAYGDYNQGAELGGEVVAGGDPVVLWRPAVPDNSVSARQVTTSFTASLSSPQGSSTNDSFSWTAYNSEDLPLLALVFEASDGAIKVVNAAGRTWNCDPVLLSGSPHRFEIQTNLEAATWTILMDGVAIGEDQPLDLGSIKPDFHDIAAGWQPNPTSQAPARMIFDDLAISADMTSLDESAKNP